MLKKQLGPILMAEIPEAILPQIVSHGLCC
jgi:hypothetical protein